MEDARLIASAQRTSESINGGTASQPFHLQVKWDPYAPLAPGYEPSTEPLSLMFAAGARAGFYGVVDARHPQATRTRDNALSVAA